MDEFHEYKHRCNKCGAVIGYFQPDLSGKMKLGMLSLLLLGVCLIIMYAFIYLNMDRLSSASNNFFNK